MPEQCYSSDLSTEAFRFSAQNLSALQCSSTDLSPETIWVFLAALWRNSFSLMAFQRGKTKVSKSLRFKELAVAHWMEF